MQTQSVRINHQIRAREVRVIGADGKNLGVLSLQDALKAAEKAGTDLIEISPDANPPVAKIADYGKFRYAENKKKKQAKTHTAETKSVQITIGTGEHDLLRKAKETAEWLREGHRIKVDLFLRGRAKYLDKQFLKGRIERLLKLIPEEYQVSDAPRPSPKGLSATIERVGKK